MTGETGKSLAACRQKEETDGTDCTSSGKVKVLQKMEAAARNEQRSAVNRRYCGMCSCRVNDDRRRRRPGRLDTGTSWFRYGGAIPFYTRYAKSASLKLTRSGRRSQCSIARSYSDEIEIANELRRWVRSADVVGAERGRKSDKHEVAVIEPGVEWTSEITRERRQAVISNVAT